MELIREYWNNENGWHHFVLVVTFDVNLATGSEKFCFT
jgi:hypothetical protein